MPDAHVWRLHLKSLPNSCVCLCVADVSMLRFQQAGLEKLEIKTSKKVKIEKNEELEAKAATREARTARLAVTCLVVS